MQFDERKQKILAAIVETYIRTGEPVGSKTLSQLPGINVSPATIRNEMALLFNMGFLEQPHTSAGRIPSHLGYRTYVDHLMSFRPLTEEEKDGIDALFNVRDPDPDRLLQDAAETLADYTGCATVAATTTPAHVTVNHIDIVPADSYTVVLMVIASNGVIKSKVCRLNFRINSGIADFFKKFSNDRFAGMTLREISAEFIHAVSIQLGEYSAVFNPLMVGIYELCKEAYDGQYYLGGQEKLLTYNEFSDRALEIMKLLNRREDMGPLLDRNSGSIQVFIGKENCFSELCGSSLIVARFRIGENDCGAIGLIGPVRMDYARLIPHLRYFAEKLGKLLSITYQQKTGDEDEE
ncbi:MAG TPA: heat-inducible transcriptional repressor HrcA [Oscillospiraceae bacterium]|nr:heat-inducible transcriptional repressor HrcA [Oscillospiraceae bacterium]